MAITTEVCEVCKKMFLYPGFGVKYCSACREKDIENQQAVKEYLRAHGAATVFEISEATGISEKIIKQYLRDGMLEVPEGSPMYIKCEACGCDIRSGRWCPSCAAHLSNGLKGCFVGVGDIPKESSGKMRFIGKRR